MDAVSVENIVKLFCFNNVVFGNALKDLNSREHVKHFLGAIADLAEILDLDICEVNKLGKLDINFATMGTKGSSASYFPSYKAINLTASHGDGSVAHEWFHYFDNVVQEGDIRKATSTHASEAATKNDFGMKQAFYQLRNYIEHGDGSDTSKINVRYYPQVKMSYRMFGNNVEESIEMIQARYPQYGRLSESKSTTCKNYYGWMAHKFEKEYVDVPMKLDSTRFYYNSSNIGTKYWIATPELFARAFEAYIERKLEQHDRKNNYLVSYYKGENAPYPMGGELDKMVVLFDSIFREFKHEFEVGSFEPFTEKRANEYVEIKEGKQVAVKAEPVDVEFGYGGDLAFGEGGDLLNSGQAVIKKSAVQSDIKYSFDGKKLTVLEINELLHKEETGHGLAKTNSACDDGCIVQGKPHTEGGVPFHIDSQSNPAELEGQEIVVSDEVLDSGKTHEFEGQQMTAREIENKLNTDFGGKNI